MNVGNRFQRLFLLLWCCMIGSAVDVKDFDGSGYFERPLSNESFDNELGDVEYDMPRAFLHEEWLRLCNHQGICSDTQTCEPFRGFPLCYDPTMLDAGLPNPKLGCDLYEEPCQNGGTCRDRRCFCPDGVHGVQCETNFTLCSAGNLCREGSTCVTVSGGGYRCFPPACSSSPCLNGGTCRNVLECQDGSCPPFECTCPSFHVKPICVPLNPCNSFPCLNQGTCTAQGPNNFRCSCSPNYYGLTCAQFDPCRSYPCRNGGTCISQRSTFRCICNDPYVGKTCSRMDVCFSNPCLNGGTCRSQVFRYMCECPFGFVGFRCETNVSPLTTACSSNPCQGVGCICKTSCMHEYGYYCINAKGFVGKTCFIPPPRVACEGSRVHINFTRAFVQHFSPNNDSPHIYAATDLNAPGSRNPLCQANYFESSGLYVLNLPLNELVSPCGSKSSRVAGKQVYRNTVWVHGKSDLFDYPLPSMDFNCTYDFNVTLTSSLKPVVDKTLTTVKGNMQGSARITLCKVSTCSETCPSKFIVSRGARYTVAESIHLSVTVSLPATYGRPSVSVVVEETFLSCSADLYVLDKIVLQNGCTEEKDLAVTVQQTAYSRSSACLSFRVPRLAMCREFYIHVRVKVCYSDSLFNTVCPGGGLRQVCRDVQKRSLEQNVAAEVSHHVVGPVTFIEGTSSISLQSDEGPVIIKVNKNIPENLKLTDTGSNAYFIYLAGGLGILFLGIIASTVLIILRKRSNQLAKA